MNNVLTLTLSSGTVILSKITKEYDKHYILDNPLMVTVSQDEQGVPRIYFVRYLPYAKDGQVTVLKHAVQAIAETTEKYADYYVERLALIQAYVEAYNAQEEEGNDPFSGFLKTSSDESDSDSNESNTNVISFESPNKKLH